MGMDVVDDEIEGSEMQFIGIEPDPGEAAAGEAGSRVSTDAGIATDTVVGGGRAGGAGGGPFGNDE